MSGGAVSSRLALTATAPATGKSGATIKITSTIHAAARSVTGLDVGAPADTLILDQGYVVGRYRGAIAGTGFGGTISRRSKTVPALSLLLSGCPSGTIDLAHPDASRRPLPLGRYQIVAVLHSEGHQAACQLVSAPTTIRIVE